ncbi:MAG: DUF4160 domain-containing protein [Flavobacteriales bacterium]|nr:DUF4160 domain-containing protein [Flavobacteriales bacterium]
MPKLYEYFGLVFLMFSNEHSPIHVHVRYGTTESVLELVIRDGKVVDVVFRRLGNKRMLPPAHSARRKPSSAPKRRTSHASGTSIRTAQARRA